MKTYLFTLILCVFTLLSNAQDFEGKITHWTIKTYNDSTQSFDQWRDWKPKEGLISVNFDTDIIKVFSDISSKYKITNLIEQIQLEEGAIYKFTAIDEDTDECYIDIVRFDNYRFHIYIKYNNFQVLYQIVPL